MRRRPEPDPNDFQLARQPRVYTEREKRNQAGQSASGQQPFFVSGGMAYWLVVAADSFYPNEEGVQLITSAYVPKGRQAFIKELRVAPYCPAPLCDPWTTSGAANYAASWRQWARYDVGAEVVLPMMGDLWRIPLGWEAAWDDDSTRLPVWTWSLRFIQGDINKLRGQGFLNIPTFSTADPSSWYLVPGIPVPSSAYPAGLPGDAVGPQWDQQRMQILPTDKISMNIPVPEDTTVALFATWAQDYVQPMAQDWTGELNYVPSSAYNAGRVPPIGPSCGSLLGYMQALNSKAALHNLEMGWGG